jgi:hypothetical protein
LGAHKIIGKSEKKCSNLNFQTQHSKNPDLNCQASHDLTAHHWSYEFTITPHLCCIAAPVSPHLESKRLTIQNDYNFYDLPCQLK